MDFSADNSPFRFSEIITYSVGDNSQPVTVTLLVNKKQAELLAKYESTTSMHFVLEYRGDPEIAKTYLATQQAYFNKGGN